MSPTETSNEQSSLEAAVRGHCPRCGAHTLFSGWTSFAERCPACGLDYSTFNVGDGPAAFLIFIVGTLTVVGALVVDGANTPPKKKHHKKKPNTTALTIGGLRVSKGWLLAQEYKHRAREGRIVE